MGKVTLLRLYQLKVVLCLGGAIWGVLLLSLSFGLKNSYGLLSWVIISLILEVLVLGKSDIRIPKFVPDKKRKVSLMEVKKHFLTMRKAKVGLLAIGFLGMFLGLSFDRIYLPLALAWTLYVYAVKDKKVASVLFGNPRSLSKKEWEEMRDHNDPQNFPLGSRSSSGSGSSV